MNETPVVTCFLRNRGDVLLVRRNDAVGPEGGQWSPVAGRVVDGRDDDRTPEVAAREEIEEETGLSNASTSLVRAGEPFRVENTAYDGDEGDREEPDDDRTPTDGSLVHPFLFECESRRVTTGEETVEHEWVPPTEILRRETASPLWTAYDRIRPRVGTVREDDERGSSTLSIRTLEVLRDEAALAGVKRPPNERETRETARDDWDALAALARDLLAARPSMAVVENRLNRAMFDAGDERTPAAVETAAQEGIDRALAADADAAACCAPLLPDRIATLSRSSTVSATIERADTDAVLVAESRPGREGVAVAQSLSHQCEVTLTTDAAFPFELDAWDAEALVVGADRVLPDGAVVNKVGTRAAALTAPAACPCYVVTASDKVATDQTVDLEERDGTDVYDGDASIEVIDPTFDVTPADAVERVVTERGPLDEEGIDALAAEHREWADWQ